MLIKDMLYGQVVEAKRPIQSSSFMRHEGFDINIITWETLVSSRDEWCHQLSHGVRIMNRDLNSCSTGSTTQKRILLRTNQQ